MRNSFPIKISHSLQIMLALFFLFDAGISFADSPQANTEQPQYLIRVGTIAPADISGMKYVAKGFKKIEELTDHRVRFELHAGGVLGDEPAMIKMVQKGDIEAVLVTNLGMELAMPESLVLLLPFLFQDEDEMDFITERYKPRLASHAQDRGIELLVLQPIGFAQKFSTIPIMGFYDLAQRKVWTPKGSTIVLEFYRMLGVQTLVSLPILDVELALSSGKVEVVYGYPSGAVIIGWYPYIRYAIMGDTGAGAGFATYLLNLGYYRDLPEDIRIKMTKIYQERLPKFRKWIRRDDEIAMLGLMKRGVNIIRWPPEEMEKLREKAKEFWEFGVDKWYPRELLDDILRDLEEYRAQHQEKK